MNKIDLLVAYPDNWTGAEAARKDTAEQVFYVSPAVASFEFSEDGLLLTLNAGDFEESALLEAAQTLLQRCADAASRTKDEVLEEHEGEMTPADDVYATLVERGDAHFNMPGIPVFEGDFLHLLNALDAIFLAYAREIGCVEQAYPTTVPTQSLLANGYLKSFPQHARLVGTIHQDFDSLTAIAENPGDFTEVEDVDKLMSGHAEVLSPTVCYHCFERHRDADLSRDKSLITAIAQCHRHEGRNTEGLTRLRTYTMREIIFFGDAEFVREWQHAIMDKCKALLSEFGMRFRVAAASDPFFATSATQKKDFQRMFRLKYELQALLPEEDRWISVASFNNHQSTLVDAYSIAQPEVGVGQSGCFGVGYERLAYALVSQKGFDTVHWPDAIRKHLPKSQANLE